MYLLVLGLFFSITQCHLTSEKLDVRLFQNSVPLGAPQSFDCAARELGFQYAQNLQPWRSKSDFQLVFDGLELGSLCNQTFEDLFDIKKYSSEAAPIEQKLHKVKARKALAPTYYVDFVKGSDGNDGSINSPFKTIQRAVFASRVNSGSKFIYLRQGTHYLDSTIKLYPTDSGLSISAYNQEQVIVSGGIPLAIGGWKPYKVDSQPVTTVYQNANNLYARVSSPGSSSNTVSFLGNFDKLEDCQSACSKFNSNGRVCKSLTYYPPSYHPPYNHGCYAEVSDVWGPFPDAGSISVRTIQHNIWMTSVQSALANDWNSVSARISNIYGLRVNNKRAIRARYPNADPETQFFPDGWVWSADSWLPPHNLGNSETIQIEEPYRSDYLNEFLRWNMGIGGPCSIFDPPESYWCSKYAQGGGAAMYSLPSGLVYPAGSLKNYANVSGAIMHAWHPYHWAIWMYEIDSQDSATRTIKWTKGGFQDARGAAGHGGSQYYIENVLEELDGPSEYYFDATEQKLYYFYNGTTAPPDGISFIGTNLKVLFDVQGSMNDPVQDLTFSGITFVDTAITYMDPHGVPSGGDWAMQHTGALTFSGTENLMINSCKFDRIDGNAVMLKDYHRGAIIQNNTFSWTGESAIVSWGRTEEMDGTSGDQPRGTQVLYNFFNEFGIWMKQASPWFQAKSCRTVIKGNIMFNGPRALINFNDGFGGANEVTENLLFNPNRESSDQGPFNSWDRLPFLTEVRNGTPSLTPAPNEIHRNFFYCNYGSNLCIDNDDGSAYYLNHDNVEIYGGHKSDFGGHSKYTYNTLQAYAQMYTNGLCAGYNGDLVANFVDGYWNNTCIQGVSADYSDIDSCSYPKPVPGLLPIQHSNTIYNSEGSAKLRCGNLTISLAQYQAIGQDAGTKVIKGIPSDSQIIQWAKDILGLSW